MAAPGLEKEAVWLAGLLHFSNFNPFALNYRKNAGILPLLDVGQQIVSDAETHQITHGVVMRQSEQRLRVIRLLLIWQLIVALLAGVIAGFWGKGAALGALAGGIIVWLPNCYFAFRAFRFRGARAATQIVRSMYAGVTGKLLLTCLLFVVVFINLKPLNAPAVFVGFICVQMLNWIVPLAASQQKTMV